MLLYPYPPFAAAGTFRGMRFVKYLPECGWTPLVVTVGEEDIPRGRVDRSLNEGIPADVVVRSAHPLHPIQAVVQGIRRLWSGRNGQCRSSESREEPTELAAPANGRPHHPSRWIRTLHEANHLLFETPDRMTPWVLPALAAALPLVRRYRPRVVYSTGPPHSSHLVALALKWLTDVPVMLDFRDPWTRKPWETDQPETSGGKVNGWLERLCVRAADRVILNTSALRDDLLAAYPHEPQSKFVVITNGYDPELPAQLQLAAARANSGNGTIRLCHPGTVYGRRDLCPMIDAIRRLQTSGVAVRLEQIGPVANSSAVQTQIEESGLDGSVVLAGRLSHAETLRRMADADVFVLFQQGTSLQIPGKLFEMLPFGKPILALAEPEGVTARTVEAYALGEVVSSSDPDVVGKAICRLARRKLSLGDDSWRNAMRTFDGRTLTRQLATALSEIG